MSVRGFSERWMSVPLPVLLLAEMTQFSLTSSSSACSNSFLSCFECSSMHDLTLSSGVCAPPMQFFLSKNSRMVALNASFIVY